MSSSVKNKLPDPFEPSKDEQTLRNLLGKCPHNQGWSYLNRYNDEVVYTCNACGEWKSV